MHRLIAIFLLVLLPLQAIWAAAEPYCQHEQGQGVLHVGHHLHTHHGDGDHDGDAKKTGKASAMADHDHHCCGSLSLVSAETPLIGALPPAELVAAPLVIYVHFDLPRIERPQWPRSL